MMNWKNHCLNTHTHTHTHTHTYIYIYIVPNSIVYAGCEIIHIYTHKHIYTNSSSQIPTHTYIHPHAYKNIYTHTYTLIHTYIHTCIYIHASIHTHRHTHTYTPNARKWPTYLDHWSIVSINRKAKYIHIYLDIFCFEIIIIFIL